MTLSKPFNDSEPTAKTPLRRSIVEATPKIDLRRVLKVARSDRARVAWFHENGNGFLEANVQIHFEHLDVEWGYFDQQFMTTKLLYEREGGRQSPQRVWFLCPTCYGKLSTLFHRRGSWECRKCFGLVYESQYITQYEKELKQYQELELILSRGRAKGVRHLTWNAKVLRLRDLKLSLASTLPRLSHNEVSRKRLTEVYSSG